MTDKTVIKLTVKSWLGTVARCWRATDGLAEQIARIESRLDNTAIDYSNEHVTGGTPQDIADIISRLNELRDNLLTDTLLYGADYNQARQICLCSNKAWIVWQKIVERYRLDELAEKYGVKKPTIRKWLDDGYEDIYERMPESAKRDAFPNAEVY